MNLPLCSNIALHSLVSATHSPTSRLQAFLACCNGRLRAAHLPPPPRRSCRRLIAQRRGGPRADGAQGEPGPGGAGAGLVGRSGEPCGGSFVGVTCDSGGRVTAISLQGRGLSGTLPPAIAGLRRLTGLYLHYNGIKGLYPGRLGASRSSPTFTSTSTT